MRSVAIAACLVALSSTVQAQEPSLARADLPRGVEARLNSIIENPATRKITGEATIAGTHVGNVVVSTGPLTLNGKIVGELIVIDANVDFQQGSEVTGDVTFVGGDAIGLENATIGGTVTMYGEGFSLFSRGER